MTCLECLGNGEVYGRKCNGCRGTGAASTAEAEIENLKALVLNLIGRVNTLEAEVRAAQGDGR